MLSSGLLSKSIQAESGKVGKSSKQKGFFFLNKFFSSCTGSQTGAKSSIFEHNSASSPVSPSSKTFEDLVAKGHSKFNVEFFHKFSARTGSLEHVPVSGKLVGSSLRGSLLHCCAPVASKVSDEAIFQEECRPDPEFRNRVLGLERMLRVEAQKESTLVPEGAFPGKLVASHSGKTLPRSVMDNAFVANIQDLDVGVDTDSVRRAFRSPSEGPETVLVSAGVSKGITELLEVAEPVRSSELAVGAASAGASDRAATAGESQKIIGLRERYESDFPSLNSSGCVDVDAGARVLALPVASASLSSSASAPASLAVVVHARSTPMHVAHNSWSDTVRVKGPTGTRSSKAWGFRSCRRFAPCLRGGGRGKFSAGQRCTGAGCRFTSQATWHRYQAAQGWCVCVGDLWSRE